MILLKSATTIFFAFGTILLVGCRDSDELRSARLAEARADEAIALFKQDIANLEIQVEKLVKKNEANNKKNERLIQANKKLRQENTRLAKQLEDVKKEVLSNKPKKAVIPKKKTVRKRVVAPTRPRGSSSTQWFQGGNLHSATVAQWENASYQNKLATASDWLAATKWKGHLNSPGDFDRLKLKAQLLVECVDETVVGLELGEMRVAEIAVALHHLSNDFSP